jgi:lipopolysaccharide export system permease protein
MIPGLKIVDRYLCREFVATLAGVLGACAVILLIARIFEEFDSIISNNPPLWAVVKYFFFVMPYRLLEIVPLATVLAVIFSVGTLARNREMLAIMSGGQSPYRSAAPVLTTALIVAVTTLTLNETFVPYCQERANYYQEVFINGVSELSLARRRNIFDKGVGNTFFTVREFDSRRNRMWDVLIFEQSDNATVWRYSLKAKSAQLIRKGVEPDRDLWRFYEAIEHTYDEKTGRPTSMTAHTAPIDRPLETNLDQYLSSRRDPDQMNLVELSQYIKTLRMRGEDVSAYITDLYLKLAFPFATVSLAMMAFAFALRAHTASLPLSFGLGIFLSMVFYAMTALGRTLGHIGALSPLVGAWGPLILFSILGIHQIRRSGFAT